MMNDYTMVLLIFGLVGANLWLYMVLWRDLLIDLSRQELFAVRDELFMKIARAGIPFKTKGYTKTRTIINGMIRLAHVSSFSQFFMIENFSRLTDAEAEAYYEEYWSSVESVPEDTQKALRETLAHGHFIYVKYTILKSTFLMWIVVPLVSCAKTIASCKTIVDLYITRLTHNAKLWVQYDSEAYEEGAGFRSSQRRPRRLFA